MKKLLLLGSEGMLGREILNTLLLSNNYHIHATCRGATYRDYSDSSKFTQHTSFEASSFSSVFELLDGLKPEVIINCVGVVKQHDEIESAKFFEINSLFPRIIEFWASNNNSKIIHFSTDCVFDGKKGNYRESDKPNARDVYGLSKVFGEISSDNSLTIRTSIIGHERDSSLGLLDWFLSQKDGRVEGYTKAFFSGTTTSYLAELVVNNLPKLIEISGILQIGGPRISKFDLLELINEIYSTNVNITPSENLKVDKSLNSSKAKEILNIEIQSWDYMIRHLYETHKTKLNGKT